MASKLISTIEKQHSIEELEKILAKLENVNLKDTFRETALGAVIRVWAERTPLGKNRQESNILKKEFESYLVKIVQLLIKSETDINSKNKDGQTVLHLAAGIVNVPLIKSLLTRGADVNAKDSKTGRTPLHNLMYQNICEWNYNNNELLLAQAEALEVLVSANADTNAVDKRGNTPIHYFIGIANDFFLDLEKTELFFRIVKIFMKYKADFKLKNHGGDTPVDLFLRFNFFFKNSKYPIVLLETLIKDGIIDVDSILNWRNPDSDTLIHESCDNISNYNFMKFLVNYGADIEVVNEDNETPLLRLIQALTDEDGTGDDCKILDYFLSLSPNVNAVRDNGQHILNLDDYGYYNYPDFLWKALIEYIAKKQSTGYLLHDSIARYISEDFWFGYQTYLDKCTEELKSFQKLKFPWINLFNILMAPKEKVDRYAKNKDLVKDFNELLLAQKYPIYGPSVVKRFSKAVQKQEIMEKSGVILSSCLPRHLDPSHLVIRKIISFLKIKYLGYLCKPESEEFKKKVEIEKFKISFDQYVRSCYKIE